MKSEFKKWVQQWKMSAGKLEEQRASELSAMTDAHACKVSEWLLDMAENKKLTGPKKIYSGLVEQQKYFMRWHD